MKKLILSMVFVSFGVTSFAANEVELAFEEEAFISICCTRTVSNPESGQSATATECATTRREACDAASIAANKKLHDLEVDSGDYDID